MTTDDFYGFMFSDVCTEDMVYRALDKKESSVLIISSGGMGGSTLLKSFYQYYENRNFTVIMLESSFINKLLESNSYESLLQYDVMFIDGFQNITEHFLSDFIVFKQTFINKGGKMFLKGNPSEKMTAFKQMEKPYTILLQDLLLEIKEKLLNKWISSFNIHIDNQEIQKLLQLPCKSYREFEYNAFITLFQNQITNDRHFLANSQL